MKAAYPRNRYLKFITYLAVVIMINMAGVTLFYRLDLTENRIYSISKTSQEVVSTLSEPLTINVFFSKNLPAPHNNTERYLRDLLEEYANYGNRYFNYRFYDVNTESIDGSPGATNNQELARNYGIFPVQIQAVEKDEVKFQKAYMGLALVHGDLIERIPTITGTDGLEYNLTTAIQKLNNKVSALLNLEDKIKINLILSSSLKQIAPLMKIEDLDKIPQQVEEAVSNLNDKAYGKLEYSFIDPSNDSTKSDELKKYDIMSLQWPAIPQNNILAGSGAIGLLMMYEESVVTIPLMKVLRIPIIGTQYQLTDMARIEDTIEGHIESLIDINEDIGVLADFGSVPVSASPPPNMGMQQNPDAASNLHSLISQNYTVKNIKLKEDTIPDSLKCFIIPGPKEPMTDYDLFQIDQFLMKGNSLAIFLDMYNEVLPGNQQGMQMMGQQGPMYIPVNSGLEKMLEHYGVRIGQSYVMDKNSFKQRMPAQFGGGESPVYFAPMIKKQNINNDPDFMRTIKGLVAVKTSPLSLVDERLAAGGINATRLLSTSDKSWEMKGRINLNPMFIQPPESSDEMQSYPIAYLLEGKFTSYFNGKSIPEKQIEKEAETDKQSDSENTPNNPEKESDTENIETSKIENDQKIIKEGKPGKIFVIASSEMIKDNILDKDGRSPNDMLILNLLDYLNNREDIAVMRSKEQRFNPLDEVGAGFRTFVKSFNIVGLPVLVVIFGLLVLFRRHGRKRQIKMMFQ